MCRNVPGRTCCKAFCSVVCWAGTVNWVSRFRPSITVPDSILRSDGIDSSSLEDAIFKMNEEVSVELVRTRAELREAYELRWQVYCVERGLLVGQDG